MNAILDEIGEGGTYDMSGIDFQLFTDVVLEVQQLPVEGLPGADVFNDTDADYVSSSPAFFGASASYDYLGLQSDGIFEYGYAEEGEEPVVYEEPVRTLALPLEMGTMWTYITEDTFGGVTTSDTVSSVVVGHGELITPGGSTQALVVEQQSISGISPATADTANTVVFYSEDLRLSASILLNAEGVPEATTYYIESSASVEPAEVASGFVGEILNALGLDIEMTTGSETDGTVRAFRVEYVPTNNSFSGAAMSGGGTEVSPDTVLGGGYYTVNASGLSGFEYEICLSYGDLSLENPGALVVLWRENSGDPWMPSASTLDESSEQVCAAGLTTFSQFALGANSSDVSTAAEDNGELPSRVTLAQNYPNPFNPTTSITYSLPRPMHVRLSVYNVLGQEVAALVDRVVQSGDHVTRVDASGWASGVYVYTLETQAQTLSRRMIIVE